MSSGNLLGLLGSAPAGFLSRLLAAQQQQQVNERVRGQQEQLFSQQAGILGLSGVEGAPAVPPPAGLDLSALPGQAGALGRELGGQSLFNQNIGQNRLQGAFGPGSDIMTALRGLGSQFGAENQNILGQFGRQAGGITGQFQQGARGLGRGFGVGAAGINRDFEQRLGRGLGMLEGRGQQAEEDISTRFRESLGNQQRGLSARGFGGTLSSNIAQGSAREESAEQRRLQEQLRGERLGLFTGLSGEALGARERLLGAGTSLGERLLGAGTNLQAGFAGQQLGAGQGGQQFLSSLNLGALGQQGQLGQFLQQQLGLGRQQHLSNRLQFGQLPIQAGFQATGQALSSLGQLGVNPPQQLRF